VHIVSFNRLSATSSNRVIRIYFLIYLKFWQSPVTLSEHFWMTKASVCVIEHFLNHQSLIKSSQIPLEY
jgi:hypothetical protein